MDTLIVNNVANDTANAVDNMWTNTSTTSTQNDDDIVVGTKAPALFVDLKNGLPVR